jgi:hypothetical protein|tara:strand:- start:28362 stop:28916 length:555 start_codon:yes stop_codon:yes gene_type:complete
MRRRIIFGLLALAIVAAPAIYAQQVNVLTLGTGGVGRLSLGQGTDGVTIVDNDRTTLTNAQVLALGATGITVVGAPGAGYVIDVLHGVLVFNYTGAYTESADNLQLYYTSRATGPAASSVMEMTNFIDATADTIMMFSGTPDDTTPSANTAVVISTTTGEEFGGGNASNQVFVDVTYAVRRTGL